MAGEVLPQRRATVSRGMSLEAVAAMFESICESCAHFSTDHTYDPVQRSQCDHAAQRDQHHRVDLFQMLLDRKVQEAQA